MLTQEFEVRAGELRTRNRKHLWCHSFCEVCDRRVLKAGETRCWYCRRTAELDPAGVIPVTSRALRVRLCIACERPFEAHPRTDAPKSYCSKACAGKGQFVRNVTPQVWDGCRMLADMDYWGPHPFATSCWGPMMDMAWDLRSGCAHIRY